jgi:hypothetical protein
MPVFVPAPAPGLGYGGSEYGYSPYGSPAVPTQPYPVSGGYGGYAYGYHSYGSLDIIPPRVNSAVSIDGFTIEVFFSESMRDNVALTNAAAYSIAATFGAPVTVTSVAPGTPEDGGYTSVLITHSGTTLGGRYTVQVPALLKDMAGNSILPTARTAVLYTLGTNPTFGVTPTDGDTIRVDYSEDMLTSPPGQGIRDPAAYDFQTTYPVPITVNSVTHPASGNDDKARLNVEGMTSATYLLTISPAEALSYDGTYLPSAATGFTGVSVGTGVSSAGGSGLLLSKLIGNTYGWEFQDTSGKVLPASTFRVDLTINAAAAVYTPTLYNATLGTFSVSDGAVQVNMTLNRVGGVEVVDISSGIFFAQVPITWSSGEVTLTLLRNEQSGHYSLLVDGVPVASALTPGFTGVPTFAAGARFTLSPTYTVVQFPIKSLGFSSSQTVFTNSWNFLHGVTSVFVGSAALTRPNLLTKRGPLVKNWGDPTPATKQDVEVRVNGVPVVIETVNPYLGLITPAIPIPLTTPGSTTVDVDYTWFPNPALEMTGLNYLGLVLNKWDLHQGWHPPAVNPSPTNHLGAPDRQRFPMGLVLPPLQRQRPILIGHRYIGFERDYTASLNSPTTLLLNQNPHAIARDTLSESPEDVSVSYEGTTTPTNTEVPWTLNGTDNGYVGIGNDSGFYFLVDDTQGRYGVGEGAYYTREEDFSFPSSAVVAVRLQALTWESDGVFTGIGFGLHNNHHLFFAGLLEINGVKHVGLLKHATKPHLASSWQIGPSIPISITSSNTFTTTSSAFTLTALRNPDLVFQILDGPQAGVYHIAECGIEVDGDTASITIVETFPANPNLWGNNTATAYIEVPWDEDIFTYRLLANVEAGSAELYVGGAFSGLALSTPRVSSYPAETTLLLPTNSTGAVFWGSLSRQAQNTSKWGFVRYGITYDQVTFHFQGIVVAAEMSDLPNEDENHEWFITEDFGYAEIDSSGNTLLLKTTANNTNGLDTTFGYGRVEPFLSRLVLTDVDATFRIESGSTAAGDGQIYIENGEKRVLFSTILYRESGSGRALAPLSSVSITAIREPEGDGWSKVGNGTVEVLEKNIVLTQPLGEQIRYSKTLTSTSIGDAHGRIIEGRFTVLAHTGLSGSDGPFISGTVLNHPAPGNLGEVGLILRAPDKLRFLSGGTVVGPAVTFAWDDGQPHTYRLIADTVSSTVVLVVDDQVLATVALALFTSTASYSGRFGARGSGSACQVEWESFSVVALPHLSCKRTLGVFVGTDPDNIDHWELPRTDSTDAPNSSLTAVVVEMDWRSNVQVRVRLDPAWGVTVFRPDLPPPPYYTGDFATEYTEPSAGWINVEYGKLQRKTPGTGFGRILFGALDLRSISQQRWSQVRYRIYTRGDENFIAPQHMVLNWSNVITSGELLRDVTPEVVQVESITNTLVSLVPTHIFADRVFNVMMGVVVLPPTDWTFDKDTQAITLVTALPSEHTLVTVTFAAGKPVTNTYLCSQPLNQSVTLLNEGTPPVPKSQIGGAVREEVFGSALNDPTDTLGSVDYILNDSFRTVTFRDDSGILYEALEFCEVDDGNETNLLSIMCDGPSPEAGWIEMALSGTSFSDQFSLPGGPKIWKGSTVATDTVGGFSQTSVLHASGNGYIGGNLGPGTAVLYPNYPSVPGPDRGALVRAMLLQMRLEAVLIDTDPETEQALEEDLDISNTVSDNVPPTYAGDGILLNPNGAPGVTGNGACVASMIDYGSTTYSRLGPWAGEVALAVRSQLSGNGYPASGMGLVLVGGASLGPNPTPTTLNIVAAN